MKITGVGPKLAILTLLYLAITIVIDILVNPLFKMTALHYTTLLVVGIILLIIGAVLIVISAKKLTRSFNSSVLMKDGLYKIFRNPIYAMYLIFIIPGVSLLLNSWLVLTTVIINYIFLEIFIKAEYKYLEEKFGEEYRDYLKQVWFKFL